MRAPSPKSQWLHALHSILDRADEPVQFFFRDDDAGWDDARLYQLLDCFIQRSIALDLAVIPASLSESLARNLKACACACDIQLGLHQHGYTHTNHEVLGRKHEFGPSRNRTQQYQDLQAGQQRLQDLLGNTLDPIFTPPWNRCTEVTPACLTALGWRVLSRDSSALSLDCEGLLELPVSVDWLRQRQGVRISLSALGEWIARAAQESSVIGIMLHHAVMDPNDLDNLRALLDLLRVHPKAQCRLMRELIDSVIINESLQAC